jgi:hypothetical protein
VLSFDISWLGWSAPRAAPADALGWASSPWASAQGKAGGVRSAPAHCALRDAQFQIIESGLRPEAPSGLRWQ